MKKPRKISVVGLGYVGLPVAVAFGKKGPVIGFDINRSRIDHLKQGNDLNGEISTGDLQNAKILFTSQAQDLHEADFHIVAVPTPVDERKIPDLTAILGAADLVGHQLKKGDIVVFESTVYPGLTEEECVPVLEKASGLRAGHDFFVGYSPERINPGDPEHRFETIAKVVSAQDDATLDIVAKVYGDVVTAGIHRAPSIKVAEAAKIIENIQRDINIALMNELALIFHKMGIDTQDVLEASRSKWNFLPFSPGLVGGHCIGVDPYYLTARAATLGYHPEIILAGRRINDAMGAYVANQLVKQFIHLDKPIKGAVVTVLGLSFKENVSDLRNTKVVDIIEELKTMGVEVQVYDPICHPEEALKECNVSLTKWEALKPADALIVAVAHRQFREAGWSISKLLQDQKGLVVDVKGMLSNKSVPAGITLWRL